LNLHRRQRLRPEGPSPVLGYPREEGGSQ
jgi:hypothetical protein